MVEKHHIQAPVEIITVEKHHIQAPVEIITLYLNIPQKYKHK